MTGSVAILLAVPGLSAEPALVAACQRPGVGLTVVRRCVDSVDLLAAAGAGSARVAVVDAGRAAPESTSSRGVAQTSTRSPGPRSDGACSGSTGTVTRRTSAGMDVVIAATGTSSPARRSLARRPVGSSVGTA